MRVMAPFGIPCLERNASSAWAMMSTMAFPIPTTSISGVCIAVLSWLTVIVLWRVTDREASLPRAKPASEKAKQKRKQDRQVDEEVAESFPASDPPSYAGGPQRIGGPKRPGSHPRGRPVKSGGKRSGAEP